MGRRTVSLLAVVALLVSMLTPRLPVSCARHVAVLKVVNDDLNNLAKESANDDLNNLAKESANDDLNNLAKESANDLQGFQGRKLGVPTTEEAEAMEVKGDKKEKAGVSRPNKSQDSQPKQQGLAGPAAARRRWPATTSSAAAAAAAGSRPRTVEMRAAGKRADPATEVYDMLRKDYTYQARRRRPINNGEPLQDEEP